MAPLAVLAIQLGLLQATSVHAAGFTPNCTIPPAGTIFVKSATTRGTMDILWSCLTIFILCTWTILHLNVPRVRPAVGIFKKFWFVIVDSHTKIKWMLFTMLMPELTLAKAVHDRASANEWFMDDERLKHTRTQRPVQNYLANMGHFVLDCHDDDGLEDGLEIENNVEAKRNARSLPDRLLSRRFFQLQAHIDAVLHTRADTIIGDLSSIRINAKRLKSRYWALNARQWALMKEWGIAELPDTPDYQLERLDSGGGLVKIIALVEIFWLALQLLVRLIRRYPSSQLEIAALAFAAQSALTYCVNFSKPRDVAAVRIVGPRAWPVDRSTNGGDLQRKMRELAAAGPVYLWTLARLPSGFDKDVGPSPIPNSGVHILERNGYTSMQTFITALLISVGGVVFGGIHCAAWNSTFPTPGERIAWRVCAILTAALPLMALVIYRFFFCFMTLWESKIIAYLGLKEKGFLLLFNTDKNIVTLRRIIKTLGLFLLVLYSLVRLFLIVEMFRALFCSAPEVFRNTWTAEIVHI